jgi:hypothetical protein
MSLINLTPSLKSFPRSVNGSNSSSPSSASIIFEFNLLPTPVSKDTKHEGGNETHHLQNVLFWISSYSIPPPHPTAPFAPLLSPRSIPNDFSRSRPATGDPKGEFDRTGEERLIVEAESERDDREGEERWVGLLPPGEPGRGCCQELRFDMVRWMLSWKWARRRLGQDWDRRSRLSQVRMRLGRGRRRRCRGCTRWEEGRDEQSSSKFKVSNRH